MRKDYQIVKIVADTLSSIPVEEAKHLGIAYLPLIEMVINECPRNVSANLNVQHGGALEEATSLSYLLIEKTGI